MLRRSPVLRSTAWARACCRSDASCEATPSRRCFSTTLPRPGTTADAAMAAMAIAMAASTTVMPRCRGRFARMSLPHEPMRALYESVHRRAPPRGGFRRPSGGAGSDVADQLPELVDVLEAAVHRGEAHIGDLVDALELAHDQFAQPRRSDFLRAAVEQLVLDALESGVDLLDAH